MSNQGAVFLFLLGPACAWCAGLGLWRTLFVLGLLHRYAPGGELPGLLPFLARPEVFWPLVLLAATEVVIDAIPNADVRWARWNGKVRVLGGMVLAYLTFASEPLPLSIIMALLGAFLAAFVHATTTGARIAAQRAGTNLFVTPVTSVTQDCMILATLLPLTALPTMSVVMLAFMIMASCMVIYIIWDCVFEASLELVSLTAPEAAAGARVNVEGEHPVVEEPGKPSHPIHIPPHE